MGTRCWCMRVHAPVKVGVWAHGEVQAYKRGRRVERRVGEGQGEGEGEGGAGVMGVMRICLRGGEAAMG